MLAEAERHYLAGDLEQAMIYYYSHLLVELDKGQVIRPPNRHRCSMSNQP